MATFRTHRRKKEASIKSGAGQEDIYQPIWFSYQKMDEFLAPVYDCGPITSTLDADDVSNCFITTSIKKKSIKQDCCPSYFYLRYNYIHIHN